MTIPLTGIKLSRVLEEFNAPQTTPLSAMLKGGAYVDNDVVGGTIPSSLPISLSDFAGSQSAGYLVLVGATVLGDASAVTVTGSGLSRRYVVDIARSAGLSDVSCAGTLRVTFSIGNATEPQAFLMPGPGAAANGGYYDQFTTGDFSELILSPGAYLAGATVIDGQRKSQAFVDSTGSSTMSASIGAPIRDGFVSTSQEVAVTVTGQQFVLDFPLATSIHISTGDVPFGTGASVAGAMECTFNYNIRVKDGGVIIGAFPVTFDIRVGVTVSAQATGA